jgi:hypothetical protein
MRCPGRKASGRGFYLKVLKLFTIILWSLRSSLLKSLFTSENTETHRGFMVTREQCIKLCFLVELHDRGLEMTLPPSS